MKNLKRIVVFIVLVVTLAGTMTTFVKVQGASTFQGYVKYNSSNPISGASLVLADCYFNILGYASTNGAGYYSFSVTLNGNSPYFLSAGHPHFTSDTKIVFGGGPNNFDLNIIPKKIAVFFWASDAGRLVDMYKYMNILKEEGYTKFFFFGDSSNVASSCQTVDAYELYTDTIFVYIIGHGYYNEMTEYSYTRFRDLGPWISSLAVYNGIEDWEAPRICLLVESCFSGQWTDQFDESPYLAMSTSSTIYDSHTYEGYDTPYEGDFSHWFFEHVEDGYNAVASFYFAEGEIINEQDPQKEDHSTYVWFN